MTAVHIHDRSDEEDRRYEDQVQREVDAFVEGQRVGRLGLGAGLCPHDMSEAEQRQWRLGHTQGAAEYVSNRRAA